MLKEIKKFIIPVIVLIVGFIFLGVSLKGDIDVEFDRIVKDPANNEVTIEGHLEIDSPCKLLWAEVGIYFLDKNGEILQEERFIIQSNISYEINQTYGVYYFSETNKIAADIIDKEFDNSGSLIVACILIAVGTICIALLIIYKIIKSKKEIKK